MGPNENQTTHTHAHTKLLRKLPPLSLRLINEHTHSYSLHIFRECVCESTTPVFVLLLLFKFGRLRFWDGGSIGIRIRFHVGGEVLWQSHHHRTINMP